MKTPLPNFICGGASKSGTTTLYDILKGHPDICLSSFKEPFFFNNDEYFKKGKEWYSHTYFKKYSGETIISDFTPSYLCSDLAANRIYSTLGSNIKFLFILRNPVDRAYSHYWHNKRDQLEDLNFGEALAQEKNRLQNCKKEGDQIGSIKYGYIHQGMYAQHLAVYLKLFGKENIKVILFEDLFSNLRDHILSICSFLNIDPNFDLDFDIKSNVSSKARSKLLKRAIRERFPFRKVFKVMIPSLILRKKLRNYIQRINNKSDEYQKLNSSEKRLFYEEYFKHDIVQLEDMLKINLDIWKEEG